MTQLTHFTYQHGQQLTMQSIASGVVPDPKSVGYLYDTGSFPQLEKPNREITYLLSPRSTTFIPLDLHSARYVFNIINIQNHVYILKHDNTIRYSCNVSINNFDKLKKQILLLLYGRDEVIGTTRRFFNKRNIELLLNK